MSRTRKVRYTDHSRWIGWPHYMTRCKAWIAELDDAGEPKWDPISPNAKALLAEVWKRYNGMNNGEISYSVREAKAISLSRSAAGRAFDELIAYGFLVITRASAFSVKTRDARMWRVTALPTSSESATNDFMKWTPPAAPEIKTQSHQRDTQSHQRDCQPVCATKEPLTVPPAGLSAPSKRSSQSHQRATSNYHQGYGETEPAEPSPAQPPPSLPQHSSVPKRTRRRRRPAAVTAAPALPAAWHAHRGAGAALR